MTDHLPAVPSDTEPATPAPAPIGLPVERIPGGYDIGDAYAQDSGPAEDVDTSRLGVSPLPLIGAISFGGIASSSEVIPIAAGATVTLGERGRPQPRTTAIGLYLPDGTFGQTVQLMGDGMEHSNAQGAYLPVGLGQPGVCWLPLRRATIRNASASAVQLGVIVLSYDY